MSEILLSTSLIYQCNFFTQTKDTIAFLKMLNHPHVLLQLDLGAVLTNKESLNEILKAGGDMIGHIHISEPHLAPLTDLNHLEFANQLKQNHGDRYATIEMSEPKQEPLQKIKQSIEWAKKCYT